MVTVPNSVLLSQPVVNETFAQRFFRRRDIVGERLRDVAGVFGPLGEVLIDEAEIVGVVQDLRHPGFQPADCAGDKPTARHLAQKGFPVDARKQELADPDK